MALILDDCCGCIKLKLGCFIIAYMNLVGSIWYLVQFVTVILSGEITSNRYITSKSHEFGDFAIFALVVVFAIFLIQFTFVIVLLVGLHQNKRGHVKAYLIFAVVCLIPYIPVACVRILSGNFNAVQCLEVLFSVLLTVYYLLVLRSYYFKMGEEIAPIEECGEVNSAMGHKEVNLVTEFNEINPPKGYNIA